MYKFTSLLALVIGGGCAHGTLGTSDRISPTTPELAFHEDLHQVTAERYAESPQPTSEFQVCVAPNGRAETVTLVRSSGLAAFDRVAQNDLLEARFKSFTAPKDARVCAPMKVISSR